MQTRSFGSTGLNLSCIGLGGMPLSIAGRPDAAAGAKVVHAALDAGMTLVDTADVYCIDDDDIGHNERLIAGAIASWSGDASAIFVATKGGLRRPGGAWTVDARPERLREACEASLAALGVERIGLYQLHAPDDAVPYEDTVGALAQLRDEGKIEHVGLSNVSVAEIEAAQAIVPIVSVQNRCNPFDRRAWTDGVLAKCESDGIAFLPYSPVGGGGGKHRVGSDATLVSVGEAHGASPYEVALAWLLQKSPAMFPIPGASKIASALSSAKAAEVTLSDAEVARIDALA